MRQGAGTVRPVTDLSVDILCLKGCLDVTHGPAQQLTRVVPADMAQSHGMATTMVRCSLTYKGSCSLQPMPCEPTDTSSTLVKCTTPGTALIFQTQQDSRGFKSKRECKGKRRAANTNEPATIDHTSRGSRPMCAMASSILAYALSLQPLMASYLKVSDEQNTQMKPKSELIARTQSCPLIPAAS